MGGLVLLGAMEESPSTTEHGLPFPLRSHRILVVAPQPFYQDRGTPIALRNVLEAASQRGNEVDLVTFPVGESIDLPGLRIFRAGVWLPIRNVPIGFSIRKVILDFSLLPVFLKRIRREKYEFIYALEEAAFLVLLLRRWHKLPLIYDMQSSLPEQLRGHPVFGWSGIQRMLNFFERWMVRKADRIVCSTGLRKYVLSIEPSADVREWIFPSERRPFPTGEPDRLRKELGIDPGSGVVLYAGNFEPYQGVERLLAAALDVVVELPGTVFVLVGDQTPSRLSRSKSAALLRERGALRLVPRQPKSKVNRFLAIADVLVSPRDDTGNIGIKIFEYMAAGKPIVATDTRAHRAVLDETRAILVDLSPEAMESAIVRLLRNRAAGKLLGDSARSYSGKNLRRNEFADRVANLFTLVRN
jgi:glycosyltransferase involved in cell wall biosynthesis